MSSVLVDSHSRLCFLLVRCPSATIIQTFEPRPTPRRDGNLSWPKFGACRVANERLLSARRLLVRRSLKEDGKLCCLTDRTGDIKCQVPGPEWCPGSDGLDGCNSSVHCTGMERRDPDCGCSMPLTGARGAGGRGTSQCTQAAASRLSRLRLQIFLSAPE